MRGAGTLVSEDVLYSATGLANAQLRRIYAMAEYEVARINLACATGTLLGYDRIRLEPIRMGTPDLSP